MSRPQRDLAKEEEERNREIAQIQHEKRSGSNSEYVCVPWQYKSSKGPYVLKKIFLHGEMMIVVRLARKDKHCIIWGANRVVAYVKIYLDHGEVIYECEYENIYAKDVSVYIKKTGCLRSVLKSMKETVLMILLSV